MELKADFRDITPAELVEYVLMESGQGDQDRVDPGSILDLLHLRHLSVDFTRDLPEIEAEEGRPRALLSFPERVVATDHQLHSKRQRFSTLHEIAHYLLPEHIQTLFLCTEQDMGFFSQDVFEREANEVAANLLFHGRRFLIEANSRSVSAATVKELAQNYDASFEATARRLVEKNSRPYLLAVFERSSDDRGGNSTSAPIWKVRYSIPSASFKRKYFRHLRSVPDDSYVHQVAYAGADVADSLTTEDHIQTLDGRSILFRMEYFTNQYNVFCIIQPSDHSK